jgi:hypothetical protein
MSEKESNSRRWPDAEAPLERALIDEFLRTRGHGSQSVERLPEYERTRLLQEASIYAASKLIEVEARARFCSRTARRQVTESSERYWRRL